MRATPELVAEMVSRYGWIAPPRPYTGVRALLRWHAFAIAIRAHLRLKRGLGW